MNTRSKIMVSTVDDFLPGDIILTSESFWHDDFINRNFCPTQKAKVVKRKSPAFLVIALHPTTPPRTRGWDPYPNSEYVNVQCLSILNRNSHPLRPSRSSDRLITILWKRSKQFLVSRIVPSYNGLAEGDKKKASEEKASEENPS